MGSDTSVRRFPPLADSGGSGGPGTAEHPNRCPSERPWEIDVEDMRNHVQAMFAELRKSLLAEGSRTRRRCKPTPGGVRKGKRDFRGRAGGRIGQKLIDTSLVRLVASTEEWRETKGFDAGRGGIPESRSSIDLPVPYSFTAITVKPPHGGFVVLESLGGRQGSRQGGTIGFHGPMAER